MVCFQSERADQYIRDYHLNPDQASALAKIGKMLTKDTDASICLVHGKSQSPRDGALPSFFSNWFGPTCVFCPLAPSPEERFD